MRLETAVNLLQMRGCLSLIAYDPPIICLAAPLRRDAASVSKPSLDFVICFTSELSELFYRTMYFSISQTCLLLWLPLLGGLFVQCNSQRSVIRTADGLKRDVEHKGAASIDVQEADRHWFTKISIGGQVFSVLIDTGSSALWA